MKTLIGMVAFVLEQYKLFIQDKITSEQFRNNVWEYANFLSRQPKLSDLVPCGKDGLPIKPYIKTEAEIFADDNSHCRVISKEEIAYQQGWMTKDDIRESIKDILKTNYGKYLERVILK
mgnify:CR=1 FL=1